MKPHMLGLLLLPWLVLAASIDDRSDEIFNEMNRQTTLQTYYGYLGASFMLSLDILPSSLSIKQSKNGQIFKNSQFYFYIQEDRLQVSIQDKTNDEASNIISLFNTPFLTLSGNDQLSIKINFENQHNTILIQQHSQISGENIVSYLTPIRLDLFQDVEMTFSSTSPTTFFVSAQLSNDTCPPGSYLQNSETCIPCPAGTFSSIENATTCTSCAPGSFSNSSSSTACYLCPSGTYSDDYGSTSCSLCSNGTFSSTGSINCTLCSAGTFASEDGSETCIGCSPGSYAPSSGSSSCTKCSAGSYSSSNATVCLLCPRGTYSSSQGAGYCMPCPPGSVATLLGATSCQPCSDGTASANATLCVPCTNGANQDHTECLPADSSSGDSTGVILGVVFGLLAFGIIVFVGVVIYRRRAVQTVQHPEGKPLIDMRRDEDFDEEEAFSRRSSQIQIHEDIQEFLYMKRKSQTSVDSSEFTSQDEICQRELFQLSTEMAKNNQEILHSADQIPGDFIDPLTKQVMFDPVVAADGRTYERRSIEIWMKHHRRSPVMRRTLDIKVLVPNSKLKQQIDAFRSSSK